jgi:hypothetical protein
MFPLHWFFYTGGWVDALLLLSVNAAASWVRLQLLLLLQASSGQSCSSLPRTCGAGVSVKPYSASVRQQAVTVLVPCSNCFHVAGGAGVSVQAHLAVGASGWAFL